MMYELSVPLHVSCHKTPLKEFNVQCPNVSGKGKLIGGLEK